MFNSYSGVIVIVAARFYLKPLSVIFAALPLAAFAQDNTPDEVVITASKISVTSSLDAAGIARLQPATSDTASLLRDIPGVSLYSAGGISSLPVIHGMADDRLNVRVDGMGLMPACPNHMNSPLSYIDPTNVASIKVFAGITPVSAGGDSIGGTILVDSAAPVFAVPGQESLTAGQLGGFYRSNGDASGGNVSATLAGENTSMSYSGSAAQSGDYHAAQNFKSAYTSPNGVVGADTVGSSAYKSYDQNFGVAVRHENHLVELKVGIQNTPYEGFPNQRMDMTENTNTDVSVRYTGQYNWGVLESRAYNQTTNHTMNFGDDRQFTYGTAPGMPMDTSGKTTGALVKGNIVLSDRDVLRIGSEIQNYSLNDGWPASGTGSMSPNTFENINNGERDRFDVFGEWEARWNPQWLSQFGVRTDRVNMNAGNVQGYANTNGSGMMTSNQSRDATAFNALNHARTDQNWDMTALSRYTPDATQGYEFGYSRKTRSANLDQMYTWSTWSMAAVMNNLAGDGNGYVGNINLKPEVAHTLSATATWSDANKEQWEVQFTPYDTYVENYIDAQCLPGTTCKANQFNVLQYVNQTANIYGMDLSAHRALGRDDNYGSFTAKGVLGYTRGVNQTTGDNLYNIMPPNAKLSVDQRVGSWSNVAEIQLVAPKTNVSQVRNEVTTGGYSLFNLRSSYELSKNTRLDFGIDNLFNHFYSLPLGSAYVGQGTTMSMNGVPWGTAVPGMGRSIYTGFNMKF